MTTKNDDLARSARVENASSPQHAATIEKAAAHTPGPWMATDGPGCAVKVIGQHGRYVANTYRGFNDDGSPNPVRRYANARLIAAAPDLLDACVEAENWIDNHGGVENDPGAADLLGMLRAAIAKAEGK